jgi:hypothetical protein
MGRRNRLDHHLVPPVLSFLAASGFLSAAQGESTRDTVTGEIPSAGEETDAEHFLTRTAILWSNPQWQEFRRIWRKLDQFDTPDALTMGGSIEQEEVNRLRQELSVSIADLLSVSGELGLDSTDVGILTELARRRLDLLSYGSSIYLTRMMPPPVTEQIEELLLEMEARIDTVAALREAGVITGAEMEEAFRNLRSSMDLYLLLGAVTGGNSHAYTFGWDRWPEDLAGLEAHLDSLIEAELEMIQEYQGYTEEYRDSLLAEFERMRESLEETRSRLPVIHDLLLSLELL